MVQDLLKKISKFLPLTYLVMDGYFGNNMAVVTARHLGLQLICKMRHDSALYIPYKNPDPTVSLVVTTAIKLIIHLYLSVF
ncbi:hypothetical protein NIES2101_34020 [Calothrix sp. HK-06]|nr:hypothetical protein NIES2101_34020 [Calothrix sp. HK-06]